MTIVNHNATAHSGLLVTGTGDELDIDVELIGGRTLRMSAAGDELGTWPIEECRIEDDPTRAGSFRIVVDGDDAIFTPVDPQGFRSLVALIAERDVERDRNDDSSPPPSAFPTPADGTQPADDPVAFLFGSPSPPVISHAQLADFENLEGAAVDEWSFEEDLLSEDDIVSTVDPDPAPISDHVPSVGDPEEDPSDSSDPDVADFAFEPEPLDDEDVTDIGDDFDQSNDDESDLIGAMGTIETDADAVETVETAGRRSRFGGSALDRLSSAIESVTTHSSETDSDSDDAESEEYVLGPNTVAEDALSSQRSLRDHGLKDAKRSQRMKITVFIVGVAAVVALFAVITPPALEFIRNYEGGAQPPPTLPVSETTLAPSTTLAEEAAEPSTTSSPPAPVGDLIFDTPSPEFVAAWDAAGGPIDQVLEFDTNPILGPFEERFTPFLSLVSVVMPNGTLDEFALVIDPSGPTEYDRVGIQALGVAIATVEPSRTPPQRASLLSELGLNVQQPLLEGINGSVESAGLLYTLVYDDATTLLTLTVAPAN